MKSYENTVNYMAREYAKFVKNERDGVYDRHDIARKSNEHYGFMSAIGCVYNVGMLQVIRDVNAAYELLKNGEVAWTDTANSEED